MKKKEKSSTSFFKTLLAAGLLGFIGGILGNFIDWGKENSMADKISVPTIRQCFEN
jgi:hypothetical protein